MKKLQKILMSALVFSMVSITMEQEMPQKSLEEFKDLPAPLFEEGYATELMSEAEQSPINPETRRCGTIKLIYNDTDSTALLVYFINNQLQYYILSSSAHQTGDLNVFKKPIFLSNTSLILALKGVVYRLDFDHVSRKVSVESVWGNEPYHSKVIQTFFTGESNNLFIELSERDWTKPLISVYPR